MRRHPFYVHDVTAGNNIYAEPSGNPETGAVHPTYTLFEPAFPFQVKLNPEEEELDRYGYDRKREALVSFSTKILRDLNLEPKVGDRFDFIFASTLGSQVREHFEILEISPVDFQRQTLIPTQVVAAADRTHKAKKP
jgi:hypothetical protein